MQNRNTRSKSKVQEVQERDGSMRQFMGLAALMFVSVVAWRIAGQLSSDALGMAVGVLFGVFAGVPAALMVMASGRRRERQDDDDEETTPRRRQPQQMQPPPGYYGGYGPGYAQQPPVIVLAAPTAPQQGYGPYGDPYGQPQRMRAALPAPETVDVRQFKVVGEKEEWVDEW